MSLVTRLRLGGESSLEEGTPDEVIEKKRRALDERLRPARLEAARRNSQWTELDEVDLVPRGPRDAWLVSAANDAVYERYRGVAFAPGSVNIISDRPPLFFSVVDGRFAFYERLPFTWTAHLEKRAARELAKAAPKPRRVLAE